MLLKKAISPSHLPYKNPEKNPSPRALKTPQALNSTAARESPLQAYVAPTAPSAAPDVASQLGAQGFFAFGFVQKVEVCISIDYTVLEGFFEGFIFGLDRVSVCICCQS